jgi:hypothetical protein
MKAKLILTLLAAVFFLLVMDIVWAPTGQTY